MKKSSIILQTFTLGKPSKKINSGYNEFGTISLYTLPPLINSETRPKVYRCDIKRPHK